MLIPISFLKDYVDIDMPVEKLGEKLTEIGLSTEKIIKEKDDIILELEITANRPDLLSIVGVAREVAALQGKKIKYPLLKYNLKDKPKNILPLEIKTDYAINPRFTGIIIDNIKVGPSPKFIQDRLKAIGQRPINNIVDITNYVCYELGNPLHAFDYNQITGRFIRVEKAKGSETFTSVDSLNYILPENAVIIKDKEKIIDLCGIKGGLNSGTHEDTKTIFIRVPVEKPGLIRRTSVALSLRSQASSIFERGVNAGGTVNALRRCVDLILKFAGGEVKSSLYDLKEKEFLPWNVHLSLNRLNSFLGIEIKKEKVIRIFESLGLGVKDKKDDLEVSIPTYRNDLKIQEDLIEEIGRIYGYNNFPKTQPYGSIPVLQIPYFKDYQLDAKIKNFMTGCGFSEIYTYSLVSEKDLIDASFTQENVLRIDNPVSRDFEYLRPTLKIGLTKALDLNTHNFKKINLFELGKVYLGKTVDKTKEPYYLSGITNEKTFSEVKGILEQLIRSLGIKEDLKDCVRMSSQGIFFEINLSELLDKKNSDASFIPLPKYPPILEDLSVKTDKKIKTVSLIENIKEQSPIIREVYLIDQFDNSRTFHIVYQHKDRNLANDDVAKIREKIKKSLQAKFKAIIV